MAAPVKNSHGIAALVIGVLEILFGIIIMACSFAVGAKISGQSSISPYWAGIPYMIPGILGIVSGITKNHCAMIAFMVLNIICFVIDGIAAILLFLIIGLWLAIMKKFTEDCRYRSWYGTNKCVCKVDGKYYAYAVDSCDTLKAIMSLLWAIIIFAILAALTSLAGSILGCIATCCKSSPPQQTVIVQQPAVIMQPQQQGVMQPQMQAPPAYGMEKQ